MDPPAELGTVCRHTHTPVSNKLEYRYRQQQQQQQQQLLQEGGGPDGDWITDSKSLDTRGANPERCAQGTIGIAHGIRDLGQGSVVCWLILAPSPVRVSAGRGAAVVYRNPFLMGKAALLRTGAVYVDLVGTPSDVGVPRWIREPED